MLPTFCDAPSTLCNNNNNSSRFEFLQFFAWIRLKSTELFSIINNNAGKATGWSRKEDSPCPNN